MGTVNSMNNITTHSTGARLEFSNIRKSFGDTVSVEADGLVIESGSLTVLLGRSGCGKTTLLNLAAGLDFPDQGSVSYDNQVLQGPAPATVLIFQTHNLFPWMTAEENVAFPLRNQGMKKADAREHARQYLTGRAGIFFRSQAIPALRRYAPAHRTGKNHRHQAATAVAG